jgi:hypothetical protein
VDLQNTYLDTVSVFSKYDNVLAYNVGNEVVLNNGTAASPFIKAAARDTKAYLRVPALPYLSVISNVCVGSRSTRKLSLVTPASTAPPTGSTL